MLKTLLCSAIILGMGSNLFAANCPAAPDMKLTTSNYLNEKVSEGLRLALEKKTGAKISSTTLNVTRLIPTLILEQRDEGNFFKCSYKAVLKMSDGTEITFVIVSFSMSKQ